MNKTAYVVDSSLGAVPLDRMRAMRKRIWAGKPMASDNPIASDRPVLEGGQQLAANVLYPASNNAGVHYYLPLYKVAVDNGKPGVELRYSGGESGNAGQLTIELTWDAPAPPAGVQARAMDHLAQLELSFLIPVQNGPTSAGRESIALQPLQQQGNGRAKSITIFAAKAQFDAVYQAMVDPNRQATLNVRIKARVGVRTWQQVVVGGMVTKDRQAAVLQRRGALFTQVLNNETLAGAGKRAPNVNSIRVPMKMATAVDQQRAAAVHSMIAQPVAASQASVKSIGKASVAGAAMKMMGRPVAVPAMTMSSALRSVRVAPAATAVAAQPAARAAAPLSAVLLSRVNAPVLADAVVRSDLQINNRQALPVRIALGTERQPAIIDTELEAQQQFGFQFAAASEVYAVAGFVSGGIHLLLPMLLTRANGTPAIAFQDNLMRDVVHIAPTQFRLQRDNEPPFLPGLAFLPADFGTTAADNAADAEVLFQVIMNYDLEPWVDPEIIELARAEVAKQGIPARFTPILPKEAKLSLDLDLLGDEQQRKDAKVETASGITDTLILDASLFTRIWRERLAQPGVGISGRVTYKLFDGTEAASDILITLWETSADVFEVDPLGPVSGQPGRQRVRVRNKIESPVTITGLPVDAVSPGVVANAADPGSVLNKRLEPQQTIEIDYQITPADAPVESIDPVVLGSVDPNISALLKGLMVSTGFSSLGFTVGVSTAAGAFGRTPQPGEEPLTGLLVEFDDGTKAKLTPESPAAEVSLLGRLTDALLGVETEQQRYFHRVTNLHPSGEGARTGWSEGREGQALEVGTAVVKLDF